MFRSLFSFLLVVCHFKSLFAFALHVDNRNLGLPKVSPSTSTSSYKLSSFGKGQKPIEAGKQSNSCIYVNKKRDQERKLELQSLNEIKGGFLSDSNAKLMKTKRHSFADVIVKTVTNTDNNDNQNTEKKKWTGLCFTLALMGALGGYGINQIVPDAMGKTFYGTALILLLLNLLANGPSDSSLITKMLTSSSTTTNTKKINKALTTVKDQAFSTFQNKYLIVHLLATFVDFMQGAYIYKIYESYGFGMGQIANLFLAGFGSSLIMSFFAGGLADKYGRRTGCIAFTILQAAACMLLRFKSLPVLFLGRILSGIATSFYAICFECWMVSEHNKQKFAPALISNSFSKYYTGLGAVSVLSGIVAGTAVDKLPKWGIMAPFDICAIFCVITAILAKLLWSENYGDETASTGASFSAALKKMKESPEIPLIGLIQSLFEGAMFTWVFIWTPCLESGTIKNLNLGNIFANYMIGLMCGSASFRFFNERMKLSSSKILLLASTLGSLSLLFASSTNNSLYTLFSFIMFEVSVGMYFPSIGTERAKLIPENIRATVMNLFRVVLNALVVIMLRGPVANKTWDFVSFKKPLILGLASSFLATASILQYVLINMQKKQEKKIDH